MNLPYPRFQVNFKVYPDTSGGDALALTWLLETIEAEIDTRFVLTPQLSDIRLITERTGPAITAPAMDAVEPGRGVGKILLETIADAGAGGAIINHAESRDTLPDLVWKTERYRDLDLDSVVCVDSIEMGRAIAGFDPDSMIYEMLKDILSSRAITQTHPNHACDFMSMVERESPRARALVGGGVSTAEDIRLAFEQGGRAADAASAASLASEPEPLLRNIATSFP